MLKASLLAMLFLLLSLPAQASEWALEDWLAEPGVRLVAVEFYADWCGPCKAAAPKWEALRKRYQAQGLKLVVVNLSETSGDPERCTRLPWNPDMSICDPALGEAMGVSELPEAFVWSWQGNLLVERGTHIEAIERTIRRYLDTNPRVSVVATGADGKADKALERHVADALRRSGKLSVVPDAEMRQRLSALRKESHRPERRDDQRCALGREVSANSLVNVERLGATLSMTLLDAERGCQLGSARVDWDTKGPKASVDKALEALLAELTRGAVEMPTPRGGALTDLPYAPQSDAPVRVSFRSEPQGAAVHLDGKRLCQATPCTREVDPGRHRVSMTLDKYAGRARPLILEGGEALNWRLEPAFGTLSVSSQPSGVALSVDGAPMGVTPIAGLELSEGTHTLVVGDRCRRPETREIVIERGEAERVELNLSPREARLQVSASTFRGSALEAEVRVDGEEVGETPGTFRVPLCAKRLEVRHPSHVPWSSKLTLRQEQTTRMVAKLTRLPEREASQGVMTTNKQMQLGLRAMHAGDFDKAIKHFEASYALDPTNKSALMLLNTARAEAQRAGE